MTFISNKMPLPLNIIQEHSVSISMKHFLRKELDAEVRLIGHLIHLTWPQWTFFLLGEYSSTKFIVEKPEVLVIWKITSEIHFNKEMNKETCAKMFIEMWGVDFKPV